MDKEQILSLVKEKIRDGVITRDDLVSLGVSDVSHTETQPLSIQSKHISLTHVLYGIGTIIVILGVGTLLANNWDVIGLVGRIGVSLGLGFLLYILSLFIQDSRLSSIYLTISGFLIPWGTYIYLSEYQIEPSYPLTLFIPLVFAVLYGSAWWLTKRAIGEFFTIAFLSVVYAVYIDHITPLIDLFDVGLWATLVLGLVYIAIAYVHGQSSNEKKTLQSFFYGFGTLMSLASVARMDGDIYDFVLLLCALAFAYLSVFFKSRAMFVFSALFIVYDIGHITYKYFAGSLGWSVLLILMGFIIIGLGYGALKIDQKFFRKV